MKSLVVHWLNALCAGDIEGVVNLYTPNAVLVATFENRPLQGHAALRGYFKKFMGGKPGLCGRVLMDIEQKASGGTIVSSGLYEFSWQTPQGSQSQKARYTFVFVPVAQGVYQILTHHSSLPPE